MRFREILTFELGYQFRQRSLWLFSALLVGVAAVLMAGADPLVSSLNAPINVASFMSMLGLLATLMTAAIFVEAGHRETRWRMEPFFHTTPLRERQYLGGRFLGALLTNTLLLVSVPAGLMLSTILPSVAARPLGPLRPDAYVLPYLFLLLPNMLLNASLLFGTTVLTRRSLPAYLGALALIGGYLITLNLGAGPGPNPTLALLDPTGYTAVNDLTVGWTPVEQNTRPIPYGGILLWNRVLWIAVAICILAFTYVRFRLRRSRPRVARSVKQVVDDSRTPAGLPREHAIEVPTPARSFGVRTRTRQTLAVARIGARRILLSREFLLIAAGLFAFAFAVTWDSLMDPLFDTYRWPLTAGVNKVLASHSMGIIITLLTVFVAGELVWLEREAGIEQLTDTRPVPDWVPFVGNLVALSLAIIVLQAVLLASGLALQAVSGYYAFEPTLYLQMLFGLRLIDYLLFAVLALLVHVLVNQKYVAHLLAIMLFFGMGRLRQLGIEHNLLAYGSDPGWQYTDLSGFAHIGPFVWFKLYWTAWATLLVVLALLFWVRGTEPGLRARIRLARQRFTRRRAAVTAFALLLVLGTGGFIFYNTNVINEYRTAWERDAIEAEYERRYKRFEHVAQPRHTGTRLHVEIHAGQSELQVRGTYRLVNRSAEAIDSIHIVSAPYPELRIRGIGFDRPASRALDDAKHGYRIFTLARPLQPGDSLQMEFELDLTRHGFTQSEAGGITAGAGRRATYMEMMRILPAIGYQRELLELTGALARREHGLPPRSDFRAVTDTGAYRTPRSWSNADWIDFEGTVGTADDQIAVLPGTLQRTWSDGGRRYYHYRADAPIMNSIHLMSGEYAEHTATWNNVAIRVLHHPKHDFNIHRMVRAVQTALEYYSEQFGPYPHRQFSLVEVATSGTFGRAFPAGMMFTETTPIAVGRAEDSGPPPGFVLLAHEIAHQWWGHRVIAADVAGAPMLSETLSQYSAVMLLEKEYGAEQVRPFLRNMHLSYLSGRGTTMAPEVPLLRTRTHEHIHYRKGPVVMYTLQDHIGADRVNRALHSFSARHAMRGPPYPTTLDLYAELNAVTPHSLQPLLHDLLATITLWDLRATGATAQRTGNDQYRVTMTVQAAKLRADSVGNDREIPMNDPVHVAVFGANGEVLYLRRHRIRSGEQSITVTVSGTPASAAIDPYHQLIARHRDALVDAKLTDVRILPARARDPVE